MISVPNYKILTELPKAHLKNGELAETSDDNKKWVYDEEKQEWIEREAKGIQMSLYDMNKQLISQLPAMEDIDKQKEILHNFREATNNSHYMLLCRELNYFTLFEQPIVADRDYENLDYFENLVLDCVGDIGIVHDMSQTEDHGAIEIWVITPGEETVCMYLFPYDAGVVYYKV